ncbi:armadillo-type protein [Cladochytrium replicatum]|nr:armadillo-type protein [Cladochytrium replicatum]
MAKTLAPKLPPNVDPTKMELAYGRGAVLKLISGLTDSDLFHRQQSLVYLCELIHNPENVAQGLSLKLVSKLTKMVDDADLAIRQKSTECLCIIAGIASGRASLVECSSPLALSKLFEDGDLLVRQNAHETLRRVTCQQSGVDCVLSYGLLPIIVSKAPMEKLSVQVPILDTLHNLIRLGKAPWIPRDALESQAMNMLTKLIHMETVTAVKVAASGCIMSLSFYPSAKRIACDIDTIPGLIKLLSDRKAAVRAAAAGALMSITIECDAKRMMVRENAVHILMSLLNDKSESVLLNTIKTITNCAEDYRGRFQLHACLKKLDALKDSQNDMIAEASKRAIEVITWRP